MLSLKMFSLTPPSDDFASKTILTIKISAVVAGILFVSKAAYNFMFNKETDYQKKCLETRLIDIRPYCLKCKAEKNKRKVGCKHGTGLECLYEALGAAKETIDICMYIFTDTSIMTTLLAAKDRGVTIRIITDPEMAYANKSCILPLYEEGVPIKWKQTIHSMHHKCCIIDKKIVLTGSFNWTEQATHGNYENLLLLANPQGVQHFILMFEHLWVLFDTFIPGNTIPVLH